MTPTTVRNPFRIRRTIMCVIIVMRAAAASTGLGRETSPALYVPAVTGHDDCFFGVIPSAGSINRLTASKSALKQLDGYSISGLRGFKIRTGYRRDSPSVHFASDRRTFHRTAPQYSRLHIQRHKILDKPPRKKPPYQHWPFLRFFFARSLRRFLRSSLASYSSCRCHDISVEVHPFMRAYKI
ncbi:hypothetical protein EJ06DRAFT_53725 [Trichodelitschia bisporula]|uniref:Secreted protein n=1 Tax=Trichodelitschia bisporula TaxID=703511 RepID=A0A6G1HUE1_9PEZI|nr:hypothetical protein EJ06DRAFT_53725 [Trichodelitschia bisporula]